MIPFYIYYSMFGFQRIGDFAWAGGDMRARGFLLGGTAGRTTLAGEGLQHQDGHSQLVATTIPNCRAYDPCFNYELAVIIQDGLRRMCAEQESVFYYITVMNENYAHPAMPAGAQSGILRGMYRLTTGGKGKVRVQLLGSGTILREVLAAAEHARGAVRHSGRRLERHELQRAAARRARRRAVERTPSRGRAAHELRGVVLRGLERAVRGGHGLHEDRRRTRFASGCRGATSLSARTASAAATAAKRCVTISRSTASRSSSRHSRRSPTRAASIAARSAKAMTELGVDPDKPNPVSQ